MISLLTLALAFLLLANPLEAATLYVNNSGSPSCSDGTVKASNTSAAPWCTIYRAARGVAPGGGADVSAQAASAGDIVLVTAGTYSINYSSSDYFDVAYDPANSGTSGNPIVFRGVGTVILQNTGSGPLIGAITKTYITWDNFTVYEVNAPPLGAPTMAAYGAVVVGDSSHVTIERFKFYGDTSYTGGNIHFAIFIAGDNVDHTNNTVKNSYFQDAFAWGSDSTGRDDNNGGAIMSYGTADLVIEHNEFYNCGEAFFSKNATPIGNPGIRHIARYNLVRESSNGFRLQETNDMKVHNNIVRDGRSGSAVRHGVTFQYEAVNSAIITNNTFENLQYGFHGNIGVAPDAWVSNVFNNNIMQTVTTGIYFQSSTAMSGYISFDRNVYYSFTNVGRLSSNYATLGAWRAISGTPDLNSSTADPQFVNLGANDLHLANNGQAALTLGRVVGSIGGTNGDTIPAGAYITGNETIGIESAAASSGRFSIINFRRN